MDSKLVVEQMSGRWKVKHPDMKPLAARAAELVAEFDQVDFEWVPRAENSHADRLANEAMDAAATVGWVAHLRCRGARAAGLRVEMRRAGSRVDRRPVGRRRRDAMPRCRRRTRRHHPHLAGSGGRAAASAGTASRPGSSSSGTARPPGVRRPGSPAARTSR